MIERIHRHVQPVAGLAAFTGRVLDDEVFAAGTGDGALDHFDETADAVLVMHDEIAGRQRQRIDLVAAFGAESAAVTRPRNPRSSQIGLGDDHQPRATAPGAGT